MLSLTWNFSWTLQICFLVIEKVLFLSKRTLFGSIVTSGLSVWDARISSTIKSTNKSQEKS